MKKVVVFSAFCFFYFIGINVYGQIEIDLRKSFIDSIKNKVTIETNFFIAKAHESPNSAKKDADLHFSGTSNFIGLPIVAEIMNAKKEKPAVDLIHENEGTGNSVELTGVWRIWCEHAGNESEQIQGEEFPPITSTNPDHVFEIHPSTKINSINLNKSLKPITGFTYKSAEDAFSRYSNARCKIIPDGDRVVIETNGVGYNYVEYWIEIIDEHPFEVEDGRFMFCKVLDKEGEIISHKMRMVFPKNSPAELKVKTKQVGDIMHVVGVPRINLALVVYRINHANDDPDILEWNLPVEMVIVASFKK